LQQLAQRWLDSFPTAHHLTAEIAMWRDMATHLTWSALHNCVHSQRGVLGQLGGHCASASLNQIEQACLSQHISEQQWQRVEDDLLYFYQQLQQHMQDHHDVRTRI
jgi:hypothetical protein